MDVRNLDFILRTMQRAKANVWIHDVEEDRFTFAIDGSQALSYSDTEMPRSMNEWLKKLHPDDIARVKRQVEAIWSGQVNAADYEHRVLGKDGNWVWVDVKAEVIEQKPDGSPAKILGITQIIHERKELEKRLADSEHTFRTVVDNAHEAIFITESDGKISFANQAMLQLSGYGRPELMEMRSLELVAPQDRNWVTVHLKRRWEGKPAPERYQCYLQRKDGSNRQVEVKATRIELPSGRVQVITQLLDVTPLREAQDDVRKHQAKYKAIFDSSHEAIFVHDPETVEILDVNQRMLEMFGVTKEEALERNLAGVVATDEPEYGLEQAINKVRLTAADTPQILEWKTKRKNGEPFWVEIHLKRVNLAGADRILAFVSDITQRKESEQEQKKLELQLRQRQKMEAIGTLAGGIAHDFNNILCAMLGYTELAELKAAQGRPVQQYLEQVSQAGIRARDLVQQILAFSRSSEQKKLPSDLASIVKETTNLLRASLPSTIEMHLDLRVKEAMVLANPINLHQIIMNLCTNAGHAMPDGGELRILLDEAELTSQDSTLHHGLNPGPYIQLVVEDNGCGMGPEIRERIFDPFFTTKSPGQGTGMGLSVVHGIIKETGGGISVYSEPDRGTKIIVLIPKHLGQVDSPAHSADALPQGNGRIMLVDDEKTVAESAREMLSILGYQVTAFSHSIRALEEFRANPSGYDLLLTDLTMPKMDGLELIARVRKLRPDLPVLLWSGLGDRLEQLDLSDLGINGTVVKPPLIRELAQLVQKTLDQT